MFNIGKENIPNHGDYVYIQYTKGLRYEHEINEL